MLFRSVTFAPLYSTVFGTVTFVSLTVAGVIANVPTVAFPPQSPIPSTVIVTGFEASVTLTLLFE